MTSTTSALAQTASPSTPATRLPAAASALLRLEGGLAAVAAIAAYAWLGGSWWLFAALILVPDLAMLGWLAGPRVGRWSYNAVHTYLAPAVLAAVGYAAHEPMLLPLAAIWTAHIGADRLMGYGLKLGDFKQTHLS